MGIFEKGGLEVGVFSENMGRTWGAGGVEAAGVGEYFKDFCGAARSQQSRKEGIRGLSLKSGLRDKEGAGFPLGSAGVGGTCAGLPCPDAGTGPPQNRGGLWGRTVGGHRAGAEVSGMDLCPSRVLPSPACQALAEHRHWKCVPPGIHDLLAVYPEARESLTDSSLSQVPSF